MSRLTSSSCSEVEHLRLAWCDKDGKIVEEIDCSKCPVCKSVYTHNKVPPKVLQCGHSTCSHCLEKLYQTDTNGILCTICRSFHEGHPKDLKVAVDLILPNRTLENEEREKKSIELTHKKLTELQKKNRNKEIICKERVSDIDKNTQQAVECCEYLIEKLKKMKDNLESNQQEASTKLRVFEKRIENIKNAVPLGDEVIILNKGITYSAELNGTSTIKELNQECDKITSDLQTAVNNAKRYYNDHKNQLVKIVKKSFGIVGEKDDASSSTDTKEDTEIIPEFPNRLCWYLSSSTTSGPSFLPNIFESSATTMTRNRYPLAAIKFKKT